MLLHVSGERHGVAMDSRKLCGHLLFMCAEHFVTNVATAGGLLLLQKIGAGKYTVDELLKKKD